MKSTQIKINKLNKVGKSCDADWQNITPEPGMWAVLNSTGEIDIFEDYGKTQNDSFPWSDPTEDRAEFQTLCQELGAEIDE